MTISFSISLHAAHRPDRMPVGLSIPETIPRGRSLPVVIFSHGAGLSGEDYRPLADSLAEQGFAVLRPTHSLADERGSNLPLWRARVLDMRLLIDNLELLEEVSPDLKLRFDRTSVFVVGHSFGAHTAELLLGARVNDAVGDGGEDLSDLRVRAGVLLAPPGAGGPENLTPEWLARAPYLDVDWSLMHRPALIVVGGKDTLPMSVRGWTWHTDPYWRSAGGNKSLLALPDGDHYLGGIVPGRGAADPAVLKTALWAVVCYLRRAAFPDDSGWSILAAQLQAGSHDGARLQHR